MRRPTHELFVRQGILAAVAVLLAAGPCLAQELTVTHQERAVAPGEVLLLTVSASRALSDVSVAAFGRSAPVFAGTDPSVWHALVAIDADAKAGAAAISVAARVGGVRRQTTLNIVVARKIFSTRRLSVDPRFVTPPESELPRIAREQKLLGELLAAVSPARAWHGAFLKPVDGAPVSNFGVRSVYNGTPAGVHRGTDFAGAEGVPIRAPGGGRVVAAQDFYYSGNTVVIDHGLGVFSLLAHMSRMDVRAGDAVEAGQVIGAVGATGRVTGPHLHWTLRIGAAVVDPLSLLALAGMPR